MGLRYLVVLVMALSVPAACVLLDGGSLWAFLGILPLALVILPPLFISFANFGFRETGGALRLVFGRAPSDTAELRMALVFFQSLGRCFWYSGASGFLIGVVMALSQRNELSGIGASIAVAVLAVLYPILLSLLFVEPCKIRIKKLLCAKDLSI